MNMKITLAALSLAVATPVCAADSKTFRLRSAGTCSGFLSYLPTSGELAITMPNEEDICIFSPDEIRKVFEVCVIGNMSYVTGLTRPCPDSAECSEVTNVTKVRIGRDNTRGAE